MRAFHRRRLLKDYEAFDDWIYNPGGALVELRVRPQSQADKERREIRVLECFWEKRSPLLQTC